MVKANTDDSKVKPVTPPAQSTVLLLLATIADTTWRMFGPILGGVFLGIWLDHSWNSKPAATVACLVLGTALAAWLIVLQLRRVRSASS
jgi:F0F1-type ATP synthase assembly protein I